MQIDVVHVKLSTLTWLKPLWPYVVKQIPHCGQSSSIDVIFLIFTQPAGRRNTKYPSDALRVERMARREVDTGIETEKGQNKHLMCPSGRVSKCVWFQ